MADTMTPCPFCGETDNLAVGYDGQPAVSFFVHCMSCRASGPRVPNTGGTVDLTGWGRRPTFPNGNTAGPSAVEEPLHPVVQEAIDNFARYYAEHHKLGMSIRSDMMYVAQLALRWRN